MVKEKVDEIMEKIESAGENFGANMRKAFLKNGAIIIGVFIVIAVGVLSFFVATYHGAKKK